MLPVYPKRRRRTYGRRRTPRTQASNIARGYDNTHVKTRASWKPYVDAGMTQCAATICLEPDRWITPGTAWDLGHTDDRTAYIGPCHMTCNRSEGGIKGNKSPLRKGQARPSRIW